MTFIPTTRREMEDRGWDSLDVILVSGDTYIDSSYNGSAVIGRWLMDNGFRVGIVAQPGTGPEDIGRLGRPELFWSVSAGCVDSMVANYTATRKFRKEDDFTPGGVNRRPDRACIAYTNLIRRHFKDSMVVLGGIEASLRRVAHYDFWSDSVRRSVLFDSKADAVTYGMAELSNLRLAEAVRDGRDWRDVRGICYISKGMRDGYIEIPGFEECSRDPDLFVSAFRTFCDNNDPVTARGLCQRHGDRYLVQNPPSEHLSQETLDSIYGMDFRNRVHPFYSRQGNVRAMETIKQSITTHRGCYGGCGFCAISVHQGRTVISRSPDSVVREAERIAGTKGFNGIIYDLGGPTANMYGIECDKKVREGACRDRGCLYPDVCPSLRVDHSVQTDLLRRVGEVEGVRRVFVSSGLRHDMIVADRENGRAYLDALVRDHVPGQMKIAPEHVSDDVLDLMGKPGSDVLLRFKGMFDASNREQGTERFLTYYLMAAHPGCREHHMRELDDFIHRHLRTDPEQVQIFTPTPSTASTAMYHARRDPRTGREVASERSMRGRKRQKEIVMKHRPGTAER